jgi:hypothetical protein
MGFSDTNVKLPRSKILVLLIIDGIIAFFHYKSYIFIIFRGIKFRLKRRHEQQTL